MTHDNKTEFFILFFSLYWLAAEFKMWLSFILQKEKKKKKKENYQLAKKKATNDICLISFQNLEPEIYPFYRRLNLIH